MNKQLITLFSFSNLSKSECYEANLY